MTVKQNYKERIRTAAENDLFYIFTYFGSLRGYETPKVLLHDLRHHILSPEQLEVLAEQSNYYPTHVSLPPLRRFKDRSQEDQRRIIDIYWETKSGLQLGIWAHILIGALKYCGITRGWYYKKQSDGTQMIMSEFADSFFSLILDIQKDQPNLIAPAIDVINDYLISRS